MDKVISLLSFLSAYIFFANLSLRNFCKRISTNIDLPVNFLKISGFGEYLAELFYVGIVNFKIVLNLVTNFVHQ